MDESEKLGTEKIGKLVIWKAVPISVGVLAVTLYFLADTIFVGHFVGTMGIGAVSVVLPLLLLISSIGTAIGVGGSILISLLMGQRDIDKANTVFGNMVALNIVITTVIVAVSIFFEEQMLTFFGAKGDILPVAQEYFKILLPSVPFMAFDLMVSYVMNAEGRPKAAMIIMMILALINIVLDAVFMIGFGWGIEGAALATTISYVAGSAYSVWFFYYRQSEIKLIWSRIRLQYSILKDFVPLGMVTLTRHGSGSILIVVLNHSLFAYGGETAVAIYGILNRLQLFIYFPLAGIVRSFASIAGFNYGAENWTRVKTALWKSIRFGTIVTLLLFTIVILFPRYLVHIFTTASEMINRAPPAMRLFFLAMPFLALQQVGITYFQAIGETKRALVLTLLIDVLIILLVLTLPLFFDLTGLWFSFPLANLAATGIIYWKLRRNLLNNLNPKIRLTTAPDPGGLLITKKEAS